MTDSNDIVSIIKNYIALEKSGNVHRGYCPFCNSLDDKLIVKQETGEWHCFNCGAGGNTVDFVRLYEGTVMPRPKTEDIQRQGVTHSPQEDEPPLLEISHSTFESYYTRLRQVQGYQACAIVDSNLQLIDKDVKTEGSYEFDSLNEIFMTIIDATRQLFDEKYSALDSNILFSSEDGIALYLSTHFREEPVHVIVIGSDQNQQYLMRMHAITLPKY